MNSGDVLEAVVQFNVPNASNPCLNVWHWEATPVGASTDLSVIGPDIVAAIIAMYVTPVMPYTSNLVTCVGMRLRNLMDPSEGYDAAGVLATGGSGSAMLPPFVTVSVTEQRTDISIRKGRKGLVGFTVVGLGADGRPTPAILVEWQAIFSAWADVPMQIEDPDYNFDPVIVRKSSVNGAPPTKVVLISDFTVNKYGTQNTRK